MTSIHLYAELLLNIKTVTFFANLKSEHTRETKAEISADGETITVSHEGESAHLKLPTKISGGGSAALTLPAQPSKDLTLRLSLEEKAPGLLSYSDFADDRDGNPVPWDATSLNADCALQCGRCGNVLLTGGSIHEWKDLPNENWAEMMDFWHCHKPDEQHAHGAQDQSDAPARKGYAAGNMLVTTPGMGYVDTMYFLCALQDCSGVKLAERAPASRTLPDVHCKQCQSVLGSYDAKANGVRLLKWAIALQRGSDGEEERHDTQLWLSAQLLSAIENTAVRKFIVRDQMTLGADADADAQALMLWTFTPDLSFSSSVQSTHQRSDPTRAMKVFWTTTHQPEQVLATQSSSFEEVLLPREQFASLAETLRANGLLLPPSARAFQQWRVSLLQRFESKSPRSVKHAIDPLYE